MDLPQDGPLPSIEVNAGGLRLRAFAPGDLAVIEEASRDPHIPLITTVPAEYTTSAGAEYIERQATRLTTRAGWPLAIEYDGRAVGQTGLWIDGVRHGRAEIGYWIVPSARGSGLAARALRLLGAWAFDELDALHRLSLFIEPWNIASITTAERAGYDREGMLRDWGLVGGEPKDMWSFARTRADHERAQS